MLELVVENVAQLGRLPPVDGVVAEDRDVVVESLLRLGELSQRRRLEVDQLMTLLFHRTALRALVRYSRDAVSSSGYECLCRPTTSKSVFIRPHRSWMRTL